MILAIEKYCLVLHSVFFSVFVWFLMYGLVIGFLMEKAKGRWDLKGGKVYYDA